MAGKFQTALSEEARRKTQIQMYLYMVLAKLLSSVAVTLFLDFHNLARCLYWETVQLQTVPPLTFMVLHLLISGFPRTLKTYLYLINYETVSFHNLNGPPFDFF